VIEDLKNVKKFGLKKYGNCLSILHKIYKNSSIDIITTLVISNELFHNYIKDKEIEKKYIKKLEMIIKDEFKSDSELFIQTSFFKEILGFPTNLKINEIFKRANGSKDAESKNDNQSFLERIIAFGFGFLFITLIVIIAIKFPKPTSFQYTVFRIVLALAAGGIAALIPGIIKVKLRNFIRAGGAIAVFVIIFFYSPANLVLLPLDDNIIQKRDMWSGTWKYSAQNKNNKTITGIMNLSINDFGSVAGSYKNDTPNVN